MDPEYDPANLTLQEYDYSEWYEEKSGYKEELYDLPPLQVAEEKFYIVPSTPFSKGDKKEGNGLKILTLKKLLTRFPTTKTFNIKIISSL